MLVPVDWKRGTEMGKPVPLGHPVPFLLPPFPTGEILPFPQASAQVPIAWWCLSKGGNPSMPGKSTTLLIVPRIFIYIDVIFLLSSPLTFPWSLTVSGIY